MHTYVHLTVYSLKYSTYTHYTYSIHLKVQCIHTLHVQLVYVHLKVQCIHTLHVQYTSKSTVHTHTTCTVCILKYSAYTHYVHVQYTYILKYSAYTHYVHVQYTYFSKYSAYTHYMYATYPSVCTPSRECRRNVATTLSLLVVPLMGTFSVSSSEQE